MEEYAYKEKIVKLKKVNIAVAIALGLIPIVALIFDPKLFSILYLISLVIVIAYLFVLRDYFVLEFNKKNTNLDTDMYCEATTPCSGLMVAVPAFTYATATEDYREEFEVISMRKSHRTKSGDSYYLTVESETLDNEELEVSPDVYRYCERGYSHRYDVVFYEDLLGNSFIQIN